MLPPRQTTYGQGNDGVYSPTQYESWGPAFDGSMRDFGLPLPDGTRPQIRYAAPSHDVRKDLFNTGVNSQNDISFAGGSENSTYFLSAQYVTQKGIIPEDTNDRVNLRFNGTRAFGNLDTKYNINFVNNRKDITPDGPWVGAYQYPANFNHNLIRDWENPDSPGNPHNYFTSARSWYRNPYFMIDNIRNESSENIINGLVELNYNFTDWFSAIYRIGLFSSSENYRNFTRKFEAEGTRNVDGSLTDGTSSYSKLNSDLIQIQSEFRQSEHQSAPGPECPVGLQKENISGNRPTSLPRRFESRQPLRKSGWQCNYSGVSIDGGLRRAHHRF